MFFQSVYIPGNWNIFEQKLVLNTFHDESFSTQFRSYGAKKFLVF